MNRYARLLLDRNKAKKLLQIYNNTVTQMSACLLSLSVMSLLLPVSYIKKSRRPPALGHPFANYGKILMLLRLITLVITDRFSCIVH